MKFLKRLENSNSSNSLLDALYIGAMTEGFSFSFCPPTLVKCDYSNGFVCPSFCPSFYLSVSLKNFLSPQLLLQISGFWLNFPVFIHMTWRWLYFIEVMLNWFLKELWSFNNFPTVSLSPQLLAQFQWILVKPFIYCSHDLKRII